MEFSPFDLRYEGIQPGGRENLPRPISTEELAKICDVRYLPSLEDLCKEAGVDEDGLSAYLRDKIGNVLERISKESSTTFLDEDLCFIGKCFFALKAQKTAHPAVEALAERISSFLDVEENFFNGKKLNSHQLAVWKGWVTRADNELFPQERFSICVRPKMFGGKLPRLRLHFYIKGADDPVLTWLKLRQANTDDVYVTERVSNDIEEMKKEKSSWGYFHSTSSSVLPGLAKHKRFLSRGRHREMDGGRLFSGELSDYEPRVYVSGHFNHGAQYSDICWFDEFPVTFKIDGKKVEGLGEKYAPDYGMSLGHEVPLECVTEMIVPAKNMEQAKKWSDENTPEAIVHSIEGYYLAE